MTFLLGLLCVYAIQLPALLLALLLDDWRVRRREQRQQRLELASEQLMWRASGVVRRLRREAGRRR